MQSEQEFLKHYDSSKFPSPIVTVDSVLFTLKDEALCVLLVKRANHPQQGYWGLPGGFIDMLRDETIYQTAIRKIVEKTGVTPAYLEQLETFSGAERDPRGWSLTTAYFALIAYQNCQTQIEDVLDAQWWPVKQVPSIKEIAFDHQHIIEKAIYRLEQKTLYSMLPVYCLPDEFTLSELQTVIETILDKPIQRKSLVRRFDASGIFEETGKFAATGSRQAKIYRKKDNVDIQNFSRNLGAD
ncbi:NUDIX hydrolase [Budviciaceae bacterium CWB-B4]|uniref:NUDIX hydrolase n=1 Tax=Limnobaculum xujianqingii TaxID=2738837 RepID=A0A9D7G0D1_9GAMM|nr:NUDIX domain-containing protein [Limnobaculum xujianqingii]MBK5075106.1 NUDIX hydrolase [Limnobaculum xujianqingii]MBK5178416.1 NUDIX hydrolase [Limnobaculum xujianqingii]